MTWRDDGSGALQSAIRGSGKKPKPIWGDQNFWSTSAGKPSALGSPSSPVQKQST
jgi:hypothetical protein